MPTTNGAPELPDESSAPRDASALRYVQHPYPAFCVENASLRAVPATEANHDIDLETELLQDVDVEADLMAVIPMPPTIPAPLRAAITDSICRQFDSDLEWLHAPHPALGGATPFERIVAGDAEAVLLALDHEGNCASPIPRTVRRKAPRIGRGKRARVESARSSSGLTQVHREKRKAAS